jgi:NADH-quinone oxidoreductase subunit C
LSSTADAPASEQEAAAADEARQAILDTLGAELGDALVATHLKPNDDVWARVALNAWRQVADVCRRRLACDYFCFLNAIDWMPSPFGRGEDDPTAPPPERSTAIVPGYTGGDTRFQLLARLYSTTRKIGVTLKTDLDDADPSAETWVGIYAGADWHERETYEMFGIRFIGHPNLINLYLPGDFEGYPLRKDFPLLARMVKPWPGIVDVEPMPPGMGAEADAEAEGGESA